MAFFNKLLLAIDLGPDSDTLLNRAAAICNGNIEQVNVVYVIRSRMIDAGMHSDDFLHLTDDPQLYEQARLELESILLRNNFIIAGNQIHILSGEPAHEIKTLAREINADLVLVGSRCKKKDGWLEIPGTTTNCVLQGIRSDVMAIRVYPGITTH